MYVYTHVETPEWASEKWYYDIIPRNGVTSFFFFYYYARLNYRTFHPPPPPLSTSANNQIQKKEKKKETRLLKSINYFPCHFHEERRPVEITRSANFVQIREKEKKGKKRNTVGNSSSFAVSLLSTQVDILRNWLAAEGSRGERGGYAVGIPARRNYSFLPTYQCKPRTDLTNFDLSFRGHPFDFLVVCAAESP